MPAKATLEDVSDDEIECILQETTVRPRPMRRASLGSGHFFMSKVAAEEKAEGGESAAAGDAIGDVAAFVAEHVDATLLASGKVRCELTGRMMAPQLPLLRAHWKGAAYRKCSAEARQRAVVRHHVPYRYLGKAAAVAEDTNASDAMDAPSLYTVLPLKAPSDFATQPAALPALVRPVARRARGQEAEYWPNISAAAALREEEELLCMPGTPPAQPPSDEYWPDVSEIDSLLWRPPLPPGPPPPKTLAPGQPPDWPMYGFIGPDVPPYGLVPPPKPPSDVPPSASVSEGEREATTGTKGKMVDATEAADLSVVEGADHSAEVALAFLRPDEVSAMKVVELKAALSERGFSTVGRKAELAERLLQAL